MRLLTHFKRLIRKLLYKSCYKKKQETKDMNEHVKEYLEYFSEITKPKYAVMITGSWGSGKTHYIKKLIKDWNKEEKLLKVEDKEIKLKPIYISLFGLSKTSQINDEMRKQLFPILYSKYVQKGKKILAGITKAALRVNIDVFSEDGDNKKDGQISVTPDIMSIFENDELTISGKKIIVFDDLERCTIPLAEVLGYINYFIEHYDCNVIIISDQVKIKSAENNENEDYKRIKEKIIGQTLEIQCDVESAIQDFIEEIGDKSEDSIKIRTDLYDRKDLIIRVFVASKTNNLRLLRHCLKDLARFIKHIDNQYVKHKNYKEFLDNFIFLFILVYMEFHSGNRKYFDGSEFEYEYMLNDDFKREKSALSNKYTDLTKELNVQYYDSAYRSEYLCDYLEKGYLNKSDINTQIQKTKLFSTYNVAKWTRLTEWWSLEEDEFELCKSNLVDIFFKDEDIALRTIFIMTGLLLLLVEEGYLTMLENEIIKRAKYLLSSYIKGLDKNDRYYVYHGNDFENLEYKFSTSKIDYFHHLKEYTKSELVLFDNLEFEEISANMFSNINDNLNAQYFFERFKYSKQ